eukprot:CAMPEP_0197025906 /NCGR_PEP_ID=MMETSP1384-20130603/6107_1 /TAXON_ID=29189 /ORGANISM="Ammonia sp." /LENGTH=525 /DNA_ID=CAMNT_0042454493 /DNA_START=149 /DNA_END=1726 /DNA_ORIENTATION=-
MQEKLTEEVELGGGAGGASSDNDKIFNNRRSDDDDKEEEESKDELNRHHYHIDVNRPQDEIVTVEDELSPVEELGHNSRANLHDESADTWTKYKLMTWNLWCIPVSSPRTLSNPDRCSSYLRDLAEKQQWQNYDGLIVVALQELWCWKTGIFPPFLLRIIALFEYIPYIGRFFSALFQLISILLGVLPILKCLPIQYDPKSRFIHKMRNFLPYAIKDSSIPISVFMDNGLCTLTNKPPTEWGCQSYESTACDDSLANKGWLWCFYEAQKLLIINTHMQAAGAGHERLLQLRELKSWLYKKWESKGLVNKCIVLGDFNVDMESHPERVRIFTETQSKKMLINAGNEHEHNPNLQLADKVHEDKDEEEEDDLGDAKEAVNDVVISMDEHDDKPSKKEDAMSKSLVNEMEMAHKIDADIYDELGDDPLTPLPCSTKESLADNLRKLKMARQGGKKTKFTKKAYINIPHHLGPTFHKLNRYEPTFKRAEYNIDHIFANFKCEQVKNSLLALGRYKLSDHRLVVSEFSAT